MNVYIYIHIYIYIYIYLSIYICVYIHCAHLLPLPESHRLELLVRGPPRLAPHLRPPHLRAPHLRTPHQGQLLLRIGLLRLLGHKLSRARARRRELLDTGGGRALGQAGGGALLKPDGRLLLERFVGIGAPVKERVRVKPYIYIDIYIYLYICRG